MLKVRQMLAECYANTCFAKVVAKTLGLTSEPHHTPKMGRDKVLVKAKRALEKFDKNDESLLIVIDYERGASRKYIDENFDKKVMYESKVYVGVFKRDKRLIAIIFDPDIEEFLCKVLDKYCNESERKALKRGDLDRVYKELREVMTAKLEKVINDIENELRQLIGI